MAVDEPVVTGPAVLSGRATALLSVLSTLTLRTAPRALGEHIATGDGKTSQRSFGLRATSWEGLSTSTAVNPAVRARSASRASAQILSLHREQAAP